jgi:hypothetical protein
MFGRGEWAATKFIKAGVGVRAVAHSCHELKLGDKGCVVHHVPGTCSSTLFSRHRFAPSCNHFCDTTVLFVPNYPALAPLPLGTLPSTTEAFIRDISTYEMQRFGIEPCHPIFCQAQSHRCHRFQVIRPDLMYTKIEIGKKIHEACELALEFVGSIVARTSYGHRYASGQFSSLPAYRFHEKAATLI